MASVNHLKNSEAQLKVLTTAFGRQAAKGHLIRSTTIGGDPFQNVAINALGEGEWDSCEGAFYRGVEIKPADYIFHPGALATDMAETDANFPGDVPHSRTATISYKCPEGIGSADTRENPPDGFEGIFKTKKCVDFDDGGELTGFSYSANPAREVAELLMRYGRLPNLPTEFASHIEYWISRIDWQVWALWQSYCATPETVDYTNIEEFEGFGLTAEFYDDASFGTMVHSFVQPIVNLNFVAVPPPSGVTPDNFSARFEGKVKAKYTENTTFQITHTEGVRLWINDDLVINAWGSSGTHNSSPIALTADTFFTVKIEWRNTGSSPAISFSWQSDSQPGEVVPTKYLYPRAEDRPRYESHIYFETPTSLGDAIRTILTQTNSIMVDVDGKLRFYCLEQLTSSFTLDDSNIDKITFRRRDILDSDPITAYEAKFKDLDSQFLEEPEAAVRLELDTLVRKNAEVVKVVDLYNTTRWQARKVLAMKAKLEVGYDLVSEVETKLPKTYSVVIGDVLTMSHRKIDGDPREYLVREIVESGSPEATEDKGPTVEKRTIVLQEWNS